MLKKLLRRRRERKTDMQTPVEKERCTGCWACANGCPAGCISMEPDEEGFLYPKIDAAACTDCGLCRLGLSGCAVGPGGGGDVPKAYALHALDRELLEERLRRRAPPCWRSACWSAAGWYSARSLTRPSWCTTAG